MDRLDGAFLTSASCKVGSGPGMVPTNQIQITQSTCIALHYIVLHCIVIIMIMISITTSTIIAILFDSQNNIESSWC